MSAATAVAQKAVATKTWMETHPKWRLALLTLYYFAIIAALLLIYGRGDFSTPGFVYQEF